MQEDLSESDKTHYAAYVVDSKPPKGLERLAQILGTNKRIVYLTSERKHEKTTNFINTNPNAGNS